MLYFVAKIGLPNFDFGWGSAPDPAGGAHIAPQTHGFKGSYTSKGRQGSGTEKRGDKRERGTYRGLEPPYKFLATPLDGDRTETERISS